MFVFALCNYFYSLQIFFFLVLWEILARKYPFNEIPAFAIPQAVVRGDRPVIPSPENPLTFHTEDYAKLMKTCWHPKPSHRPSFKDIHKELCRQRMMMNDGGGCGVTVGKKKGSALKFF